MSSPIDHKKPTAAFVVLLVIATAIMGQGLRARADDSTVVALGPGQLSVPAAHGVVPPAQTAAAAPMARVITDATAARPAPRSAEATPRRSLGHEGDSVGGSPAQAPTATKAPARAASRSADRLVHDLRAAHRSRHDLVDGSAGRRLGASLARGLRDAVRLQRLTDARR